MTAKPLNDAHLQRMLAEYRRRVGRTTDDPLTPRPPEVTQSPSHHDPVE